MSKSLLRVDGQILNVNRYVTPPPPNLVAKYDDIAFITDVSPTTPKLGLEGNLIHNYKTEKIQEIFVNELSEEQVSFLVRLRHWIFKIYLCKMSVLKFPQKIF